MKDIIKSLDFGDIHYGHPINKAKYIDANIDIIFKENDKEFRDLDVIYINGDITDTLLSTNSEPYEIYNNRLISIARYCRQYNIKLRILEGTPSHDMGQASMFNTYMKRFNIKIDYKYIDELYIEQMDDLGITVLYIPDALNHDAEDTYRAVKELMKSMNITKVDFVKIHGQFHYQIPYNQIVSHQVNNYISICKYYIVANHVHKHSVHKDMIIAPGSVDRLKHNEEEDKGMVYTVVSSSGEKYHKFIKNKGAMIFDTIDLVDIPIDDVFGYLDKILSTYKVSTKTINIRLRIKSSEFTIDNSSITKRYSKFKISYKDIETVDENIETISLDKDVDEIDTIEVNKENVEHIVMSRSNVRNMNQDEKDVLIEEIRKLL